MLKKLRYILLTVCFLCCGALLLALAPQTASGARRGLAICAEVLIPSLFPFLVLSSVAAACALPRPARAVLGFVARRIYLLPPEVAPALLMSWLGGYPAGAKVLSDMVRAGTLSPRCASRAMTCCVNSGPAFMAAIVGGTFGSAGVGLAIFGCQLLAGIATAWVFALLLPMERPARRPARQSAKPAESGVFVRAVGSASSAMLTICAFAVLFSALLSALDALGVTLAAADALARLSGGALSAPGARCLLSGMAEICCGCAMAARLPAGMAAAVLPFLLSFSSLSVIFQNCALFSGSGVSLRPMALSRLLHGALTAVFTFPWLYRRTLVSDVYASGAALSLGQGFSASGAALMVMLAAMVYISVEQRLKSKKST